jgi:cytochrome c553
MSNTDVEQALDPTTTSQQFKDEYERAVTAQVGTMSLAGTNQEFGARNVSHRVSPALLPDGHVAYTEWRHMGGTNDGHLRMMNTDMTGMKEAFGGELAMGLPSTNSYLKARYVQTTDYTRPDGQVVKDGNYQMVAIATSRDRTLQAGKLFLIDLNGSEANSVSTDLTPSVPGDRSPSPLAVGRYYDAEPIGQPGSNEFLVSWSGGPVESETLALGNSNAQFGVYFITAGGAGNDATRFPIYDDPAYWDVLARPVKPRQEPLPTTSPIPLSGGDTTIGAINVYNSSVLDIPQGSVVKVRLIEGFSGEELTNGYDMFGSTEFDGQSLYGEIPVQTDNSFAAVVPGNVPFHIQLIDKFAMAVASGQKAGGETDVANESIWISGRAGEQRFCGGCHESRSDNTVIQPGITEAVLRGPVNLVQPRAARLNTTAYNMAAGTLADPAALRGVPWDKAIQPILDAQCVSCHGANNTTNGPSYTVMDNTTMTMQTFYFDLTGNPLNVTVGERMTGAYTASYITLMGLGEILGEDSVTITGNMGLTGVVPGDYVKPAAAERSNLMKMLNPPQRFPTVDMNTRAFTSANLTAKEVMMMTDPFKAAHASVNLTADQFYLLILNIDMGGQFFFRENLQ